MIICQSQKTPYVEFHCLVQICYIYLSSCTYSFRKSGLHCMILGIPRYDPKVNSVSDVTDISSWQWCIWTKPIICSESDAISGSQFIIGLSTRMSSCIHRNATFNGRLAFLNHSREIIIIVLHLGPTNVWIMTLGDGNILCSLQTTHHQQQYKENKALSVYKCANVVYLGLILQARGRCDIQTLKR